MSFWKMFFAILFTRLVADLTYLRLAFFEYDLNLFAGENSFVSLLKFIYRVEPIRCAVYRNLLFVGLYPEKAHAHQI